MLAQARGQARPARSVLMVRPAAFGFNVETAETNAFQHVPPGGPDRGGNAAVRHRAVEEFDGLVRVLRDRGVEVVAVEDTAQPVKPDAVFPCNWISFHTDGSVILYPMQSPLRRRERRTDVIDRLEREHGFEVGEIVDLTAYEDEGRFLEGSGSLVFDDANACVYASLSPRTDPALAREVASVLGYDIVLFAAADDRGRPLYHTDVVLALGADFAVVAAETIRNASERATVLERLRATGRDLVPITFDQLACFAANILEIEAADGERVIVMSDAARRSLAGDAIETIERYDRIVHADLATIESVGGGGARCMIADIHLPRRG